MTAIDSSSVILAARRSAKTIGCPMLLLSSLTVCMAQGAPAPSNTLPRQRFVAVAPDVKLEVLDWGGSGRSLVLLAGGGNTAHVFASLAPKLACAVSTFMESPGAELACPLLPRVDIQQGSPEDDIVAVLDALSLSDPVLSDTRQQARK